MLYFHLFAKAYMVKGHDCKPDAAFKIYVEGGAIGEVESMDQ